MRHELKRLWTSLWKPHTKRLSDGGDEGSAPHYDIELSVRLTRLGSDGGFSGSYISGTGVLVTAEGDPRPGAIVQLRFPGFKWTAQAVWTQDMEEEFGSLLAMKFLSLSEEDAEMLVRRLKKAAAAAQPGSRSSMDLLEA